MVDSSSFFGDIKPEYPEGFDGKGRYLLNVDGLGDKAYTRATTLAKSLDNTFALENYNTRVAVKGVTARPDLVARAAVTKLDDKKSWREILMQAEVASGGGAKANMGTAFHVLHENVGSMTDEEYAAVPADVRLTYERYRTELARLGIAEVVTEAKVANTAIGVAGTLDGLVRLPDGRVVVADRKSGRVVEYPHAPAAQLATYSHSDRILIDGEWRDMASIPNFDPTMGLVFDVKIGDENTASTHVYEIDLEAGWYAALLATKVRRWGNRKDLLTPYQPEFVGERRARPPAALMAYDGTAWLPTTQEMLSDPPVKLEDQINAQLAEAEQQMMKHIPATGAPEVFIPGANVVATPATPPKEQTPEAWGLTDQHLQQWGVTAQQVADGEHTQLADKIRQAAELALSSPNPDAVAAGERLLSREAETKQAAAMAELNSEARAEIRAAGPISDANLDSAVAHKLDADALLKIYKTKAALQAVARQVDPQMNVARQRGNLASDMVSHPNWPSKRADILGLAEDPYPPCEHGVNPGAACGPCLKAEGEAHPEWLATADRAMAAPTLAEIGAAMVATPGTEAELLGNAPVVVHAGGMVGAQTAEEWRAAQVAAGHGPAPEVLADLGINADPYGGEAPAADPPSAPLSDEDRYINLISHCINKEEIGGAWSAAQAESVPWSPRLHQAASARIASFTP